MPPTAVAGQEPSGAGSEARSTQRKRARSQQKQSIQPAEETTTETIVVPPVDPTVLALFALARQCGYVLKPTESYKMELSLALCRTMINRGGQFVYQAAALSMPFQKEAAELIFRMDALIVDRTDSYITWRATNVLELRGLLGDILPMCKMNGMGISRALKTASERASRVVATLAPPMEISWVKSELGLEKIFLNIQYVLFTEAGDIHWPKSTDRAEISFSEEEEKDLRVAVLQDVNMLSTGTCPLAPRFWRQLGQEDKAQEMEQLLAQSQVAASRQKKTTPTPPPPREFPIAEILEERRAAGKAKSWFLVRWEGYEEDWENWRIHGEVGSAVETWEPLCNVRKTQAYLRWQEAAEQEAAEEQS